MVDHYRMHSKVDSEACPPELMGCFERHAPPLSTKLIVNTRCVARMGTHYVTELSRGPGSEGCRNIYHPLHSKETRVKGSVGGGRGKGGVRTRTQAEAALQQDTCVLPLHLNHYAVKSREDYLHKFQRGRDAPCGSRESRASSYSLGVRLLNLRAPSHHVPSLMHAEQVSGS